ncbi:hypothetical protein FF011L_46710 [Roseimaritima multifibrata]|uniref:Uncharacterized protein n=1 Tax=Roseimaritima multifibrata TaxID=1930274 RepID=A0A517MLZ3_9BACT|nr:hypothetical protein FF011L_46710 [Roseimaritima multifibrata]
MGGDQRKRPRYGDSQLHSAKAELDLDQVLLTFFTTLAGAGLTGALDN